MSTTSRSKPKNVRNIKATAWQPHKEGEPDDGGEEITCPTGQTARVKVSMGIKGLVEAGVIDQMDSLSSIVESEVVGPKRPKKPGKPAKAKTQAEQARELMADKNKMAAMLTMIDAVTCHVVIDPPVLPVPVEDAITGLTPAREVGEVYVDRVNDADEMFIFNHAVAGVRDLEQFRTELGETLDRMDDLEAVGDPAE